MSAVLAQESGLLPGETSSEPKIRPITITAWVADHIPPAIPVLISPQNNQLVTTGRPQFRWYYTADNIGVVKYQLFIDGELFQDNIPIASQATSEYALDYIEVDQIYGLTHSLTLADGIHTWKIKAYDVLINNSESATWTFTIDTVSPAFVITKIVDDTTSISAQDVSTIPEDPIVIPTRNPILQGTGEAKSAVIMTVRFLSGKTEDHAFTISDNGAWQIQLFDLPRGEVISLNFTITDQVGHISTLIDVPLQVKQLTIVIPGITEPVEIIIPEILEPILQPTQIVEKITFSPLDRDLPSSLQTAVDTLPITIQLPSQNILKLLLSIIGLLLISSIPVAKIWILLSRFGRHISLHLLKEILQVIGLLPSPPPHGIVFEVETQEPTSFATVVFQGKTTAGLFYTLTKLTNKEGLYSYHRLPEGNYQAVALVESFRFPTLLKESLGFFWTNFYRGQTFATTDEAFAPSLFIPMDQNEDPSVSLQNRVLRLPARNKVLFVGVISIAVLIPSVFNLFAALVYLASTLNRKWRAYSSELVVVNTSKEPLARTIVRVQVPGEPTLRSLTQTDAHGVAKLGSVEEEASITILKHRYELSQVGEKDTLTTTLTHGRSQITLVASA